MPAVTIVIPTYNSARFLRDAIRSVQLQSFSDWELIVVDDGSTDGTEQLLQREIQDPRIRSFRQHNQGDAAARNTGILASQSPLLAFLDADDLWKPDKLRQQVAVLAEFPSVSVVYTGIEIETLSSEGQMISRTTVAPPEIQEDTLYEELLIRNVITGSHSSVMVRRDAITRVGLFDARFRISDIDLWIRLSLEHDFFAIREPLVTIRKHGQNSSNNKWMMADNHLRLYSKLRNEVPDPCQQNLSAAAISRFGMLTLGLIRRGFFRQALRTGWLTLQNAVLHPSAMGKLVSRMQTRAREFGSHQCNTPFPGLLFPHTPHRDTH